MKIKNYVTGSVLFLAVLACVVPGLSQPAALPTFDQNTIPTVVALTANAAMAQTAAAASPTPMPAPTQSATATPKVSFLGTSLFLRDDQITVFTDHRTGIELNVPEGWLAVRINEPEYYDAWVLPELSDPAFQRALGDIQGLDPNETRLAILDAQEGHRLGSFVTNITLFWYESEEFSLENDKDLRASAKAISKSVPDLKILTTKLSTTSSGIPIGITTLKRSGRTEGGENVVAFYKQVFVNARTGVLTITLTTPEALKDIVIPAFDAMIETLTLVKE